MLKLISFLMMAMVGDKAAVKTTTLNAGNWRKHLLLGELQL